MKLSPWEPDLITLVSRIDSYEIDLQPDFQRLEVWPTAKKRKLVDTVIRQWSIPPVHFVVSSDGTMVVLDGQQRLAAIRDFVHNKFPVDGRIAPVDVKISSLHGKYYRDLDGVTKRSIDNFTIRAFKITDYLPEEPNELFYRLNQPTVLTAGEQRNALFGVARDQLKLLVSTFETEGNLRETIGFSNARMAYDDVLAKLLFFRELNTFGIKSSEGAISERFKLSNPFNESVMSDCLKSIYLFSDARRFSGPHRFNKATLLSWLMFYMRFEKMLYPEFMEKFINLDSRETSNYKQKEAKAIFDDRSSLRVSDISSVVLRDFTLWFAYYALGYRELPEQVNSLMLQEIYDVAYTSTGKSLEEICRDILDFDSWSASL